MSHLPLPVPGPSSREVADPRRPAARRLLPAIATATAVLAGLAVANQLLAKRAERRSPPHGRFLDIDGVRLHHLDLGSGPPVVLLHGNGSMIEDFVTSGLCDRAARRYRVIAFDRPGFGHSTRPRDRVWTAEAQADLLDRALRRMGITSALVVGHSWGASVAAALAVRHPDRVTGLVLASGYFFPTARADAVLMSAPAVPVLGDVLRHTLAPMLSRLAWPLLLRKIFGPAPVPTKFRAFPREMAVRPSQLRAAAAESALLVPTASAMANRYKDLRMPLAIVAGAEDRLIDPAAQSRRLHRILPESSLHITRGAGHMVHQTRPEVVLAAIDEVHERQGREART